ncbi:InlB B-repeat-containing protein [Bifidobacterium sp. SO1]|uniref:InlB B-repeat-containing protein n=1 Tax=Bifidobacterium sp. SO1 TaxID=2809029 RepID=UPI001BDC0E40|nr:InlB B-repeat-containing protein [Bifidobacterium sp. SO1]MBT1162746.1 InlB B-repeat-containing protein [Bifidobacterium sp. SO1]
MNKNMLKTRGGGRRLACLTAILLLALTAITPAHAASSYRMQDIGSTALNLTDQTGAVVKHTIDGKTTVNGITPIGNKTVIRLEIHGTVSRRLSQGDTIIIPLGTTGESHFRNDRKNTVINLNPTVNDSAGNRLFDAKIDRTNGNRIILTATQYTAGLSSSTFTLRPEFTLWNDATTRGALLGTTSTWTIAGRTLAFPNTALTNRKTFDRALNVTSRNSFANGFSMYWSSRSGDDINRILAGQTPAIPQTQDRILTARITPLDGPISRITTDGFHDQWRLGYDANTLGVLDWRDVRGWTGTTITVASANAISSPANAAKTLKSGQRAMFKDKDGSWWYAVNLGPLKDDSLPEYDMSDRITQSAYDKARKLGLTTQVRFDGPSVFFTVNGVRQRAKIDWQSSPGGSGTLTLSNSLTSNDASGHPLGWIAYDGNGATGGDTPSQSGPEGDKATIRDNGFTHPGYTFTGWNTKPDGTGTAVNPGASSTFVKTGLTLYAQWKRSTTGSLPATGGRPWWLGA